MFYLKPPRHISTLPWLRENAEIEVANGTFVSTSINLKNKTAGDGCRDKAIEKTILRAFRARTFSRSQGHSRRSDPAPATPVYPNKRTFQRCVGMSQRRQQRK
jgi:hypothetical protein